MNYYKNDGKPIADRVAGPDEWQCDRCGDMYDESQGYAEVDGGYLCEECAADCGYRLTHAT